MVPYVARTRPFADFLLVLDRPRSVAAGPARSQRNDANGCLFLSGLVELDGTLIDEQFEVTRAMRSDRLTPDLLAGCRGLFTAVLEVAGSTYVVNDLFGLEHIYLLDVAGWRVVSNRFACLVQFMKAHGLRRSPNFAAFAAGLYSRHHFFRQIHSHRLPIEGLALVPVDRYLEISSVGVSPRTKTALAAGLAGRSERSYAELIDEAAGEVRQSVRAVAASPLFSRRRIDLTGGRDSRLTIAAARREGVLGGMRTVTDDIAGTDDLWVALPIAAWAGCRFLDDEEVPQYSKSVRFKLMLWRSMSMGLYHLLNEHPWSALGSHFGTVRLTGGCGEVYSRFWLNAFEEILDGPRGARSLPDVFATIRGSEAIPEPFRDEACESFVDAIEGLPGHDLAEKIENHYLFFRNRLHFGLGGINAFHGILTWSPLVSPSLLAASRRLPFDRRLRNRVNFDLLVRLEPALAFFGYNGGERWPDEWLREIPGAAELERQARVIDAGRKHEEWCEAGERRRSARRSRRRVLDPPPSGAWLVEYLRETTSDVLARARQSSPEMAVLLPPSVERRLAASLRKDLRLGLLLASKIFAVYDCCFDEEAISLRVDLLPLREEYELRDPLAGAVLLELAGSEVSRATGDRGS